MNKVILLIVTISLIFHIINAAVYLEAPDPADKLINKCRPRAHDLGILVAGESKQVKGKCLLASCSSDRFVEYASCGAVGAGPGCHVIDGDLSLPYPECCPQVACD